MPLYHWIRDTCKLLVEVECRHAESALTKHIPDAEREGVAKQLANILDGLGGILEAFGGFLGTLWTVLEAILDYFEASGGILGGMVGANLRRLEIF